MVQIIECFITVSCTLSLKRDIDFGKQSVHKGYGTFRAKTSSSLGLRPGRFAQKIERDGSRKKTGTIRSKSNLEVDSHIFVIYIYIISVLLCK